MFWPIFGAKKFFLENPALSHTTSYGFLASYQNLAKTNDVIPRKHSDRLKERRKDGQKDGQALFRRSHSATAGDPKILGHCSCSFSCEGLSPSSLRMQGQVPGSCNQATTNKTLQNADNEDYVIVLGEWEDLFGNSMKITSFNRFSCESSNEDNIHINCNNEKRQKWTKTLNIAAMECYFLSRPID